MKRADAQKIVNDLNDQNQKEILIGLFTELRDSSSDNVIANYQDRLARSNSALAAAMEFIENNFKETTRRK